MHDWKNSPFKKTMIQKGLQNYVKKKLKSKKELNLGNPDWASSIS